MGSEVKFTESSDGLDRTTINVKIRLDREEISQIKKYLRDREEPYSDTAVIDFVKSLTEFHPLTGVYGEEPHYE